jgi:hypothetical protein
MAGDGIIPLGRGGYGVLRGGGNLYRPIPKGANGVSDGYRNTYLKPTQHYYTRNSVVSYRYVEDHGSRGSAGSTYNGPRAAIFQPGDDYSSRTASIRTFAAVTKRWQPGVPMIPKARETAAISKIEPVASIARR